MHEIIPGYPVKFEFQRKYMILCIKFEPNSPLSSGNLKITKSSSSKEDFKKVHGD